MNKIFEIVKSPRQKKLTSKNRSVFKIISNKWPVNPLEVAKYLGEEGDVKKLSAKYLYHFKKLHEKDLIRMKKVGNTYIAWPVEIEKLRLVHELTKEM